MAAMFEAQNTKSYQQIIEPSLTSLNQSEANWFSTNMPEFDKQDPFVTVRDVFENKK